MLRILICAGHDLMRTGMKMLLKRQSGLTVCSAARTSREAVHLAVNLRPDVAILDVAMPSLKGLRTAKRIKKVSPWTRILILSSHCSNDLVRRGAEAGVLGYVTNEDPAASLVLGVRTVAEGKPFFSNVQATQLLKAQNVKNKAVGAA